MRARITILIVKVVSIILNAMNRGGSLPGKIALTLDPNILKKIHYPEKIILVSGTNGKTTTNNMVYEVMKKKYQRVICNNRGDNLLIGITTLITKNTSMNLRVNADCVVIEVDELNIPHVLRNINVTTIMINNFFRDQLDRAGEMENVVSKVSASMRDFEGQLILNGDDPNVVRIADIAKKSEVYYYGVDKNAMSHVHSDEASEGKFCFRCNHELVYDFYQYSHIGRFHCPECAFGNNEYYLVGKDVHIDAQQFTVDNIVFTASQDALYAIYNCMGVLSVAKLFGIDLLIVRDVLASFELNDGRMERFDIGRECLLNLIKNPTGANEVMKYIMRDQENKDIVIVLNDNDQDGRDISWIWDANFELLMQDSTRTIICSGLRAYDMALRLKYANFKGNIEVLPDIEAAIDFLKNENHHAYVISTYTALQKVRAILRRYVS